MLNKNLLCYSLPPNHVWANGGMADTQVLGTCLARGFGSSPNSPTSESNNTGKDKSVVPNYFLKFVAVYVALKKKCCKVERVCIEGFNSEPLASLRN